MATFFPYDGALRVVFLALLPLVFLVYVATPFFVEVHFLQLFVGNVFLTFALLGVYIMHILLCDNARERRAVLIAGTMAAAVVGAALLLGVVANIPVVLFAAAAFLAAVSLGINVSEIGRCQGWARRRRIALLRNSMTVPLSVSVTPLFLWVSIAINPTFDPLLFIFDKALLVEPSARIAGFIDALPLLAGLFAAIYVSTPLAMSVLCAHQYRGSGGPNIIVVCVCATAVGFALYFVFPIAGPPAYLGDVYPHGFAALAAPSPASLLSDGPRNGMPSLHAAWAYLLWLNSRGLSRPWRWAFAIYALLTLVAAVGLREAGHWLVDLVVSLPFALAIQAVFTQALPWRDPARWGAIVVGSAAVALWLLALRYGVTTIFAIPALPWMAIIATVRLTLLSARRLAGERPRIVVPAAVATVWGSL